MNFRNIVFGSATLAIAVLIVTAPAQSGGLKDPVAQSHYGWYIEGRFGGALDTERDVDMFSPNVAGANGRLVTEADDGFGFTFAVGKQIDELWRAELQYGHGTAEDLTVNYANAPLNPLFPQILPSGGDITINSLQGTLLRSWRRTFFNGRLRPFSGASIGAARIDIDNVGPAGSRFLIDDDDTVFLLAHHSGIDVNISERAVFTLRLSGVLTTAGDFQARDTLGAGGIMQIETNTEYDRVVTGGIRIKLGQ